MEYTFKEFTGRNVRLENRITVTKSHSIGLPTNFFKKNNIANFKYVVLFYDEEKKAIGIHFTNDENKNNKFAIIKNTAGNGGSVVTRSFFKTFNIDTEIYYGRYEWTTLEVEGTGKIYVINLKENKKHLPATTTVSSS